jgi:hypothetical protein
MRQRKKVSEEEVMYGSEGVKRSRQPVVSVLVVFVLPFSAASAARLCFQSEWCRKHLCSLAAHSKRPKRYQETLTKKAEIVFPRTSSEEQRSRKQDTNMQNKERWVVYFGDGGGFISPNAADGVVGSCRYGRRGLGRGAIAFCFVILPRFPWCPLLLSVVIRPANRTNLMHHRERNAVQT